MDSGHPPEPTPSPGHLFKQGEARLALPSTEWVRHTFVFWADSCNGNFPPFRCHVLSLAWTPRPARWVISLIHLAPDSLSQAFGISPIRLEAGGFCCVTQLWKESQGCTPLVFQEADAGDSQAQWHPRLCKKPCLKKGKINRQRLTPMKVSADRPLGFEDVSGKVEKPFQKASRMSGLGEAEETDLFPL